ncbi:MAG TPA: hypothetical protein PLK30_09510 [Blastocatellia bacterium]|nr:hypothetical protein [Blastocatellia bacterium]
MMIALSSTLTTEQKQAALNEVLASHTFARSEQLRSILKFICEREMAGQGSEINEYLIGVEVMRRPPDYSPNEDGAVRNRAYALRNKLQEFYTQENPHAQVKIELPKGSYCPYFIECGLPSDSSPVLPALAPFYEPLVVPAPDADSKIPATPASLTPPLARSGRRWVVSLLVFAGLAISVLLYNWAKPQKSALDEFWEPVLESHNPVLICTTQPVVYQLTGQARANLLIRLAAPVAGKEPNYDLPPGESLRGEDVAAITDQYMGIGTAHATAQLTGLFARMNKASQIKIGNEASFADLRHSPVVSVGAFGNRWTMSIANHLRFVFEEKSIHQRFIVDKTDPKTSWGFEALPITGKVAEDFVIVSRVFQSETGEMLITAAGITQYGTRAAGEFLTNPVHLKQFAHQAVAGWQKKNLQIVFSVKIIDNTPGPPTILATHFW